MLQPYILYKVETFVLFSKDDYPKVLFKFKSAIHSPKNLRFVSSTQVTIREDKSLDSCTTSLSM